MKSIKEIAKEIETQNKEKSQEDKKTLSDSFLYELLGTHADYTAEEFAGAIKNLKSISVDNLPKDQKIHGEVAVLNQEKLKPLLLLIFDLLKRFEFPDLYKVEGEVTVKNQISIPEVDFPEYPKEIAVNNLVDYSNKLDEIKKELSKIDIKPQVNVSNPAPEVSIDLDGVKTRLESIVESISQIQVSPQVNIDLSDLRTDIKSLQTSIESIRFPVPNFQSSWQHSLDMQSKDLAKTYAYTTVNGTKCVDYIQFTGRDGNTYRKTFSYSSNDGNNPDGDTGWVKQ